MKSETIDSILSQSVFLTNCGLDAAAQLAPFNHRFLGELANKRAPTNLDALNAYKQMGHSLKGLIYLPCTEQQYQNFEAYLQVAGVLGEQAHQKID